MGQRLSCLTFGVFGGSDDVTPVNQLRNKNPPKQSSFKMNFIYLIIYLFHYYILIYVIIYINCIYN